MEMESQPSATGAVLTNMTFGRGEPLPSFATWIDANLEKNNLNSTLGAKKPNCR